MKSAYGGIGRVLHAFKYSFDGFVATFKTEAAFRQDLFFCSFLGAVLFFIPVDLTQALLMGMSLFFILFAELVNTAVEAVVDRISDDWHELSKKAKDVGSLLVLLSFINMAVVWGSVLYGMYF